MKLAREDVIAYLEGLSAMELAALIVELQNVVGLPEPLRVRETEINVVSGPELRDDRYRSVRLVAAGDNRVEVIKVIRAELPYGLHEVKELVDRAPVELRSDIPREEAEDFAKKLREAGAEVYVYG